MSPFVPTFVAVALLAMGVALGAPWVLRVLGRSLDDRELAAVLRRLFAVGNVGRAVRLVGATDSPLCAGVTAAVLACERGVDPPAADRHYREAVDASPGRVMAPVRARYDAAFDAAMGPVRDARYPAAPAALMLLAAALASWPVGGNGSYALFGLAALGLGAMAAALREERRLAAGRGRLFDALAPYLHALARNPARVTEGLALEQSRVRAVFEVREPGREPRSVVVEREVVERAVITIGAGPGSDVELHGAAGVAAEHARVELVPGGATLVDLGAPGGTRLNGEPVQRRALFGDTHLWRSDVISVGEAELTVSFVRG